MFIRNAYECYFCLLLDLLFRARTKKCMGLSQGWGRKKVPCIFFYLG